MDVLPGSVHADGRQVHGSRDSVIEIRDHGPGIDAEDANRVFERFYRADSSRQRETGGTGLGLAIVAAIVAQHDGAVRLEQTPGGGATLSVRLPWVEREPDDGASDGGTEGDSEGGSEDELQDGPESGSEVDPETGTDQGSEDTSTGSLPIPPRPPQPPGTGRSSTPD